MNGTILKKIVIRHAYQGRRFTVLDPFRTYVYEGIYDSANLGKSLQLRGVSSIPGIERISINAISKVSVDWHGNVEITVDTLGPKGVGA